MQKRLGHIHIFRLSHQRLILYSGNPGSYHSENGEKASYVAWEIVIYQGKSDLHQEFSVKSPALLYVIVPDPPRSHKLNHDHPMPISMERKFRKNCYGFGEMRSHSTPQKVGWFIFGESPSHEHFSTIQVDMVLLQ